MKNVYKQKRQEGFTIIEVLIVLAIAALILLIVLLAVPALQRNSRNTGRNSDAFRFAAAVNNFVANRNGTLPTTTANVSSIITDTGTLGQYGTLTAAGDGTVACVAGSLSNGNLTVCKGAAVTENTLTNAQDGMVLAIQAQCDFATQGAMQVGSPRQMALLYSAESGGANGIVKCVNV